MGLEEGKSILQQSCSAAVQAMRLCSAVCLNVQYVEQQEFSFRPLHICNGCNKCVCMYVSEMLILCCDGGVIQNPLAEFLRCHAHMLTLVMYFWLCCANSEQPASQRLLLMRKKRNKSLFVSELLKAKGISQ